MCSTFWESTEDVNKLNECMLFDEINALLLLLLLLFDLFVLFIDCCWNKWRLDALDEWIKLEEWLDNDAIDAKSDKSESTGHIGVLGVELIDWELYSPLSNWYWLKSPLVELTKVPFKLIILLLLLLVFVLLLLFPTTDSEIPLLVKTLFSSIL